MTHLTHVYGDTFRYIKYWQLQEAGYSKYFLSRAPNEKLCMLIKQIEPGYYRTGAQLERNTIWLGSLLVVNNGLCAIGKEACIYYTFQL